MKKTTKYEKPEMKIYDMESAPLMLMASGNEGVNFKKQSTGEAMSIEEEF